MDRWAARSHQLAARATDEGRLAEEIVGVTVKTRKDGDRGRGRRGDPARDDRRGAREAASRSAATTPPTRPATRPASTTAPARSSSPRRSGRKREGRDAAGPGALLRHGRRRLRLSGPDAGEGGEAGAREDRQVARRRRPLGDQRGVRLGGDQLGADARGRRGEGQRERRRDRPRPPDRRLGRADRRRAGPRAAPPRRRPRLRRDLLRRRPGRRDRPRGQRRSATARDVSRGREQARPSSTSTAR